MLRTAGNVHYHYVSPQMELQIPYYQNAWSPLKKGMNTYIACMNHTLTGICQTLAKKVLHWGSYNEARIVQQLEQGTFTQHCL